MEEYRLKYELSINESLFFNRILQFTGNEISRKLHYIKVNRKQLLYRNMFPDEFYVDMELLSNKKEKASIQTTLYNDKREVVCSETKNSLEGEWKFEYQGKRYVLAVLPTSYEEITTLTLSEIASNMIDELGRAYEMLVEKKGETCSECSDAEEELLSDMKRTLLYESEGFLDALEKHEDSICVKGTLRKRGEKNYWHINTYPIIKKLTQRGEILSGHFPTSIYYIWKHIERKLEDGSLGNDVFVFAFGQHIKGNFRDELKFQDFSFYKEVWAINFYVDGEKMEMVLKRLYDAYRNEINKIYEVPYEELQKRVLL